MCHDLFPNRMKLIVKWQMHQKLDDFLFAFWLSAGWITGICRHTKNLRFDMVNHSKGTSWYKSCFFYICLLHFEFAFSFKTKGTIIQIAFSSTFCFSTPGSTDTRSATLPILSIPYHPYHFIATSSGIKEVQPALPKQRELETLGDYNRRLQQAVKEKLQVGLLSSHYGYP